MLTTETYLEVCMMEFFMKIVNGLFLSATATEKLGHKYLTGL